MSFPTSELNTGLHTYLALHGSMHLNLNPGDGRRSCSHLYLVLSPSPILTPPPPSLLLGNSLRLPLARYAPSREVRGLCVPTCLKRGSPSGVGPRALCPLQGGGPGSKLPIFNLRHFSLTLQPVCLLLVHVCEALWALFTGARVGTMALLSWGPRFPCLSFMAQGSLG